jgi:putative hydrolase of the HAD superfamily
MTAISMVLFDLNGVLYRYDKAARVARLAGLTGQSPAAVDGALWGSGFEDLGDAGTMSSEEYLRGCGQRLAYPLSEAVWADALLAALAPIPDMLALAAQAGRRAKLGVLTNNNLLVAARMDRLFPDLRRIFGDAVCVSSQFQARKPESAAYQRCLARLGAAPEESLFIDDSAANVAGAERAGLLGHHHTDTAALVAKLTALRLL